MSNYHIKSTIDLIQDSQIPFARRMAVLDRLYLSYQFIDTSDVDNFVSLVDTCRHLCPETLEAIHDKVKSECYSEVIDYFEKRIYSRYNKNTSSFAEPPREDELITVYAFELEFFDGYIKYKDHYLRTPQAVAVSKKISTVIRDKYQVYFLSEDAFQFEPADDANRAITRVKSVVDKMLLSIKKQTIEKYLSQYSPESINAQIALSEARIADGKVICDLKEENLSSNKKCTSSAFINLIDDVSYDFREEAIQLSLPWQYITKHQNSLESSLKAAIAEKDERTMAAFNMHVSFSANDYMLSNYNKFNRVLNLTINPATSAVEGVFLSDFWGYGIEKKTIVFSQEELDRLEYTIDRLTKDYERVLSIVTNYTILLNRLKNNYEELRNSGGKWIEAIIPKEVRESTLIPMAYRQYKEIYLFYENQAYSSDCWSWSDGSRRSMRCMLKVSGDNIIQVPDSDKLANYVYTVEPGRIHEALFVIVTYFTCSAIDNKRENKHILFDILEDFGGRGFIY